MARNILITIMAVLGSTFADPILFGPQYFAPGYASPYANPYTNPYASYAGPPSAAVVAAPQPALPGLPPLPAVPALPTVQVAVPALAGQVPAAAPVPASYASVSAYSYGSAYNIQDYSPAVNQPSLAYSLPYAYAADWFYRR